MSSRFKNIKLMTMLKNVMLHSVESSSTTISSCSPTTASSTSPEGSSLLYEKANNGLGLAQNFMVQQTEKIQLVVLKIAAGLIKANVMFSYCLQTHSVH